MGRSSTMSGMLIGSGIHSLSAIAKSTPVFSQLGFSIHVTKASDEDMENNLEELKSQKAIKQKNKNQNLIAILVLLSAFIGLPILIGLLCMLSMIFSSG